MATDPTTAAALDHARQMDELYRRVAVLEAKRSLAHASIDGGHLPVYDTNGNLQATFGVLPDGTYGPNYYNPNPPPVPAPPTVTPTWGGLTIGHFGTSADGSEWPMDVSRLEIHISSLETFLPSPATLVGSFTGVHGGGVYAAMGLEPGTTYWVRLVAVNTSNKFSPGTDPVSGTPDSVVSQEVLDQIDADLQQALDDVTNAVSSKTGTFYNDLSAGDPTPEGNNPGDTWFRPDEGYKAYRWDGDSWEPFSFGSEALANGAVTSEKLVDGAVTAAALEDTLAVTIADSSTNATAALAQAGAVEFRVDIAEEALNAVEAQAASTAGLVTEIEVRLADAETQAVATSNSLSALTSLVTKTTSTRHAIF